jgi:hypothetical protein
MGSVAELGFTTRDIKLNFSIRGVEVRVVGESPALTVSAQRFVYAEPQSNAPLYAKTLLCDSKRSVVLAQILAQFAITRGVGPGGRSYDAPDLHNCPAAAKRTERFTQDVAFRGHPTPEKTDRRRSLIASFSGLTGSLKPSAIAIARTERGLYRLQRGQGWVPLRLFLGVAKRASCQHFVVP